MLHSSIHLNATHRPPRGDPKGVDPMIKSLKSHKGEIMNQEKRACNKFAAEELGMRQLGVRAGRMPGER